MRVLVTGGGGGIGSAIVEKYKCSGFDVLAPNSGELDLSSLNSIEDYFLLDFDVDVLVCCAGINNPSPFLDLSKKDLNETLNVNLVSNVTLAKKVIPKMVEKNFGRIVNVSSLWSFLTVEDRAAYSISKAGLDALTRSLAVEFGKYNILVNSILPGFVDTALTRKNLSNSRISEICKKTPIRNLVSEHDIANMAYYLGSKENGSTTGQSIVVDGGYGVSGL